MLVRGLVVYAVLAVYSGDASPTGGGASDQTYDTIIVGLGSAGTTAASTLSRAGKRVLALEAQDRIGGRVKTVSFGDGVVELGAEWIQGTENSCVYEAAIQHNITILRDDTAFNVYLSDGSVANNTVVGELVGYAMQLSHEPPEVPEPVGQYITRKILEYIPSRFPEQANETDFIDGFLNWLDLTFDSIEASNSWNDVSTFSDAEDLGGHQSSSWHRHGYKTFFEILLNTYNNGPGLPNLEIKLNTEVTRISWPQEPTEDVVVTTRDGATYRAKNVIITVSLGVLKENYKTLFSPRLPDGKITAIEKMSIGVLGKIILSFEDRWWASQCTSDIMCDNFGFIWKGVDKDNVSEHDKWTTKIVALSKPLGSTNTLTFWTAGGAAISVETLPEDEVKRKALDTARKFLGKNFTIPEPTGMLRTNWHSNPFTRGSYTYDNLLTPQYPNSRVDLGKPLLDSSGTPRVLFAGEATEPKHYGYVHGASETGLREANRLLQGTIK